MFLQIQQMEVLEELAEQVLLDLGLVLLGDQLQAQQRLEVDRAVKILTSALCLLDHKQQMELLLLVLPEQTQTQGRLVGLVGLGIQSLLPAMPEQVEGFH